MDQNTPTPGPWEARKFGDTKSVSIYAVSGNLSLASVREPANARLIAAAPDLADLCRRTQLLFDELRAAGCWDITSDAHLDVAMLQYDIARTLALTGMSIDQTEDK